MNILAIVASEADVTGDLAKAPELRTFGAEGPVSIHLLARDEVQLARAHSLEAASLEPGVHVVVMDTRGVPPVRHLAHAVALLRSECDDAFVWVNGDAGAECDRADLAQLAHAYELPVKHLVGNRVTESPRYRVGPGRLVRALHFAVSRTPSDDNEYLLREMGFAGLVGVSPDGKQYAPTPALLDLFTDRRFVGVKETESACADLLDRLGDHRRARKLRELVQMWVRNRLWSVNQVPEMVAHNEDHAVAVDRNVSFLCEFITDRYAEPSEDDKEVPGRQFMQEATLRKGEDGRWLSTRDVYLLAVAAWLHDWGHASLALDDDGYVTDPVTVRNYHGYMSFRLIKDDERSSAHGLGPSPDMKPRDRYVERADRAEVALLCAHHQGNSSCGTKGADQPRTSLKELTAQKAHTSFADRVQMELGEIHDGKQLVKASLERLGVLLALLRVADAADMGAHRTPDFDYQEGGRTAITDSLFQLRAPMETSLKRELDWVKEMAQIREDSGKLRVKIRGLTPDKVDAIVQEEFKKDHPLFAKARPKEGQHVSPAMVALWGYALHVERQSAYYEAHHAVRCALPFISHERRLHLAVVAQKGHGPKEAWRGVETDMLREFGLEWQEYSPGQHYPEPRKIGDPAWKEPIRAAFKEELRVPTTINAVDIHSSALPEFPPKDSPEPGDTPADGDLDLDLLEPVPELDPAGAVWSVTGDLRAVKSHQIVTFTSTARQGSRAVAPEVTFGGSAEAALLAVGWVGDGPAVAMSYPDGLALVGPDVTELLGAPGARAAALLPDAVLWVDAGGVLQMREGLLTGAAGRPPGLATGEVIHLDAIHTGKEVAVAVLAAAPAGRMVHIAVLEGRNWTPGVSLTVGADASRVRWSRTDPGGRLFVLGGGEAKAYAVGASRQGAGA